MIGLATPTTDGEILLGKSIAAFLPPIAAMYAIPAILCVEANTIISARANDVRAAQQLGGIIVLPFAGIYAAGKIGIISLNTTNPLIISAILLLVDAFLSYLSTAPFRREEIVTKWK